MKCSLCGMQMNKNLCAFCGSITIVEPLISQHDIEQYPTINNCAREKITHANQSKNFIIKDDVLIKYTGKSDIVIIPENIRVIAGHCFKDSGIKKVKISAQVEYIGNEPRREYKDENGTFEFCEELESVFFEENSRLESIELYAFYGCKKLKEIIGLPKTIQAVKSHSFAKCDELSESSKRSISENTLPNGLAGDWNK